MDAILVSIIAFFLGAAFGMAISYYKRARKKETTTKSRLDMQRAVIKGQLAEQLFPIIAEKNPFVLSDMRFLGQPVDYVVFVGHTNEHVEAVYFVEVKTGKSRLSEVQQSIKSAVENQRVYWMTVRFD